MLYILLFKILWDHDLLDLWRTFAAKITCSFLMSYYAILILHSATCIIYSATLCSIMRYKYIVWYYINALFSCMSCIYTWYSITLYWYCILRHELSIQQCCMSSMYCPFGTFVFYHISLIWHFVTSIVDSVNCPLHYFIWRVHKSTLLILAECELWFSML